MTDGMQQLLVGISAWLGGTLTTGAAAYLAVVRNAMTKKDHTDICDSKQQIVAIQLEQINATLVAHGKKLDRILINGRKL